ncbi:MAG: serine hydroxymethyltransferase, partial [Candidatus Binataceae bacterium]
PSGIRIGTPALTTRGMKEAEMLVIAGWIAQALEHRGDVARLKQIRNEVLAMAEKFPLYSWLRNN